ncbi:MAG: signal recognition particle protein [bacterium]|nr:signal recognition particle protein [bacterium]
MLETLTDGFKRARERLGGVRILDEENVKEALGEVRSSLLEADVDYAVVKDFLARVQTKALGEKVETRVKDAQGQQLKTTPGQHFVAVCEEELVALMGPVDPELARDDAGVTSIMLLGLQGVGKTTIAAKLARHLSKEGRKPLLVAADVYRPAAVLQLQQLGESIDVPVHAGAEGEAPASICRAAREHARSAGFDAIIYDTAGRLAIDDELMVELEGISEVTKPANALLVCDALMGRDAVNVAQAFSERLHLDGLVLTKLDGDSRGGAALAVKTVTGVPIKFIGTGETVDRLEPFRPEGMASRILGMGDIVGLVKDFEEVVDTQKAEEDAERMLKGQFGMDDLLAQLKTIQKMGPLKDVLGKLPMFGDMADQVDERELTKVESMIQSMTVGERQKPAVIDKSRAQRIARGSGRAPKDVTDLITRFSQMRKMMASLGSGGGLLSKIPGMGKLSGAGMGGDIDPAALMGGMPGMPGGNRKMRRAQNKGQKKNKRKSARAARRKGRKK